MGASVSRLDAIREERRSRLMGFAGVIRKSMLLNLVVVFTSFPVLVAVGGPKALVPAAAIMTGISLLIWSLTFALYSFVALLRMFCMTAMHRKPPLLSGQVGVSDRWMDDPR